MLQRFTPRVEVSEERGVFWLDASSLQSVFSSLELWGRQIVLRLKNLGFMANVAVGFSRFGTYVMAKSKQGVRVFENVQEERAEVLNSSVTCLELSPGLHDTFQKLGVQTIRDFLCLRGEELLERWGRDIYQWHQLGSGELYPPLHAEKPYEAVQASTLLDDPEADSMRLLFLIKALLHPLLQKLHARGQGVVELRLRLFCEQGGWQEERLAPAAPTLDVAQLLDLVRLRLEVMHLRGGAVEIQLELHGVEISLEQLRMFVDNPRRDVAAAERALARLRAEWGDDVVVRANLRSGHLPEATFVWNPLRPGSGDASGDRRSVEPHSVKLRPLVRRIFTKPMLWEEDGFLDGMYRLSGGWWNREIHRDYYFAKTQRDEVLWVFYDARRKDWFVHGCVE